MTYPASTMSTWYQKPPGSIVVEAERTKLKRFSRFLSGGYVLQMGGPPSLLSDISKCDSYHLYLESDLDFRAPALGLSTYRVVSDFLELSIMPNSLQSMVVVHVAEFFKTPSLLLQEAYQALAPNGYLILFGFNPHSTWGLRRLVGKKQMPWSERFWSLSDMKGFLKTAGFQIRQSGTLCFKPPIEKQEWIARLSWLERFGELCLPGLGGVYFILAHKEQLAFLPCKKTKRVRKKIISQGCPEPTTRVSNFYE